MSRYELIVFDFDGTLVDTVSDIAHYANEVLRDFNCAARPVAEIKKAIGWGVRELFVSLVPELERDQTVLDQAVISFRTRYNDDPVRATVPMPGVFEALEGPLKETRKAVVTNKPQDVTERILARLGLERFFDPVIGMHGAFAPKPDPASTLFAMRQRSVPADRTVFIGDSRVDCETARNAGIDFIWMTNGYDDSLNGIASLRQCASAFEWKDI
jgi:phosphoglycolate phosphatase